MTEGRQAAVRRYNASPKARQVRRRYRHSTLGRIAGSLEAYRAALRATDDPFRRAILERRIADLLDLRQRIHQQRKRKAQSA